MKLTATKRKSLNKSETKEIRRSGDIPAVLYSVGKNPTPILVKGAEFHALLRILQPGQLATHILPLLLEQEEKRVIVKGIQRKGVTYEVLHLDFEELLPNVPISVKVPVVCVGVADCIGVKAGGFLRQITRHIEVKCLPEHMPSQFVVNVTHLDVGTLRRLKDVEMPPNVRSLTGDEEVIVVVAKK